MSPRSIADHLQERVHRILLDAKTLFTEHSEIHIPKTISSPGILVVSGGNYWGKLSVDGQRLSSRIRDEFDRLNEMIRVLMRTQDRRAVQGMLQKGKRLRMMIDQDGNHQFKNGDAAFKGFAALLMEHVNSIQRLHDRTEGEHVYVPDTNALIYNPKIDEWKFDGSARFTIVLMPTVLGELDKHKVNDRNESVRDKAKSLIRQIMEYRRRGSLSEGVTIRKDKIRLQTVAVEPDFADTLSWLDGTNNDDRILAGFIEVVRQHPRSPVLLVTGDINLTNKADYAGLPCIQPPDT